MSNSFKNISVVAAVTLVSRFLGLGRDMLVTTVFGVGPLASAFYTAFTLPNLFRRLLGEGALTAAFVPTINEELREKQRVGAFALVNTVASWLFVASGTVVVASMAGILIAVRLSPHAEGWGIDTATIQRWLAAADLAVVLFPYLICVCLAAVLSAALQTFQRFVEPALSPIWLNLAMLTLLGGAAYRGWATTSEERMLWLCGGALLGGFLQMVVPMLALAREGWRPHFDLSVNDPLRQMLRLMGPTVFGSAIYLINISVSRFLGLSLNESAVAVLNLATRLMELPIGVFTIAISTVIFPLISKYAAGGDWTNLENSYRKGLRLILVINVPAAVGLVVLALPIVRLLFQRGAFDAGDTQMLQPVLIVFAGGLPFFSFVNMVLRAFYAQKDTRTPVRAATLSFVVNIVLSIGLMRWWGTVGLAAASNISIVVQAVYLQTKLTGMRDGFAFRYVAGDLVKVVVAAMLMGVFVAGGWWLRQSLLPATKTMDAYAVIGLVALGAGTYGALLWAFRIEGRSDLAAVFGGLRRKFS